jgi:hypothetical protein
LTNPLADAEDTPTKAVRDKATIASPKILGVLTVITFLSVAGGAPARV